MLFRRGVMLVLSSPSGAGKTSISRKLLQRDENIGLSVSATTRKRRPGEVEGEDYFFVDETDFKLKVNQGYFLEYAEVFGHYYGTPSEQVTGRLETGKDVLFDIDWQGTQQLKANARDDLVSIFILPPTLAELERRLYARAQDSADIVAGRMAKAAEEMSHYPEYDYVIVNHDLEHSVQSVCQILAAERMKRERLIGLNDFVKQLRSS